MCILCNLPASDEMTGLTFLHHMDQANKHMKSAEQAMLEASKKALAPEHRKHYANAHKRLVKARRAFNRTEQKREPMSVDR